MNMSAWPERIRLVDRTSDIARRDILFPFALDEVLCREVGQGVTPLVHLWRHPRAFVMGLRDRRLPNAEKAMAWLREENFDVAVRNSGGAAVPLDPGVVNLSVILPNPERSLQFRQDFRVMVELIGSALRDTGLPVAAGEIMGAYCPGDFDLSIRGRKFCGIAQRRQIQAYIVQAFVVVQGSGEERARRVRQFYDMAAGMDGSASDTSRQAPGPDYPMVEAGSMASLDEFGAGLSSEAFAGRVCESLADIAAVERVDEESLPLADIGKTIDMLRSRYDR